MKEGSVIPNYFNAVSINIIMSIQKYILNTISMFTSIDTKNIQEPSMIFNYGSLRLLKYFKILINNIVIQSFTIKLRV